MFGTSYYNNPPRIIAPETIEKLAAAGLNQLQIAKELKFINRGCRAN